MDHGFKNSITALIETSLLNILMTFTHNGFFSSLAKLGITKDAWQACLLSNYFKID